MSLISLNGQSFITVFMAKGLQYECLWEKYLFKIHRTSWEG